MSTAKKLGGKQFAAMKENRIGALKFYATMIRTGRGTIIGAVAAEVHKRLLAIHRMPNLSNQEKDDGFRDAIRTAATVFSAAERLAAGSDSAPAVDAAGEEPAQPDEGLRPGPGVPEV